VQGIVELIERAARAQGNLGVEHVFEILRVGAHQAELDWAIPD
jgi:hypothetical protein